MKTGIEKEHSLVAWAWDAEEVSFTPIFLRAVHLTAVSPSVEWVQ